MMRRFWAVVLGLLLFLVGCGGAVEPTTAGETASAVTPTATFAAISAATPDDSPATATATALPSAPLVATATSTAGETATAAPTDSPLATATATLAPTETPTATPAGPQDVNGIPFTQFIIMPPEVIAHIEMIYASGQQQGRNPYRLSRLGDSTIMKPNFLAYFDDGYYDLGEFAYLQPVIDYYTGSFRRVGVAARVGLHAWGVLDPFWSYKQWCNEDEHMLDCEFRHNNPAVLFIRLGTNDGSSTFEPNLRRVVEYTIAQGVIPILGTKPDRFEGDDSNNEAIRRAALDYQVPLWDFDLVAATVPDKGLDEDDVHLVVRYQPHDYNDPDTFASGHAIQDLTALLMLNEVWQFVTNPAD